MRKLLSLAASCAVISMASTSAMAQSMDYTSLQDMFGEPVTTSATGKPQRMSEVPMTMEILTQDDIRRSGANNIPEVLRKVNGVNVVQKTEQQYDVAIRGYNQHNSQRLLVLVNGRQAYLDHYGYTDWAAIPVRLEEIRQIEVVKGPNTALFGFNAVNGVVNIVTYNPIYDDVSSAGVTLGTGDYREAHYVQSLKLTDKIATRFSAGGMRSDNYDNDVNTAQSVLGASATDANFADPLKETLNLDTMFQITDKSQLRLELSGSNVDAGTIASNGGLFNAATETKDAKLSYELDSSLGLIKANLYKNFLDIELVGSIGTFDIDNEVLVAQLEDTIQLNPNHTLRLQTEFRSNELTGAPLLTANSEVSYEVYAGGAMWNWNINDQWSWTNAARVDHLRLDHQGPFSGSNPYSDDDYDRNITEFSYNSGLLWKPTEKDTLRLSTARGLEVPALLEFGLDVTQAPVYIVGDPDLETAVVTNYELAWDRKVDAIDGLFRSAVFHNNTKDVKSIQATQEGFMNLSSAAANIGDSDSYGIELELEGKINSNFDWGVGYIYQTIDDDLANRETTTNLGVAKEFEDSNPQHQVNVELGYKTGAWELDGLVYYVSGTTQFGNRSNAVVLEDVDSYVGVNARVGYTFDNNVTLAVQGQQLQSSDVQTSTTPDVDRRVFLSLSKKF